MKNLQDWVVLRLPEKFCWSQTRPGEIVKYKEENCQAQQVLILLQVLSPDKNNSQSGVKDLQTLLNEIQLESKVIVHQSSWRLIINQEDEHAASCCLKNSGIAMATSWSEDQ